MKKLTSLILIALLASSALTACSAPEAEVEGSSATASTATDTSKADNGGDEPDTSLPSWKRDTTPVEVEWFFGFDWASFNFDPENNISDAHVLAETGTSIKYSVGDADKLNALIATNNLPDIVTYNMVSAERLAMEDNGLLYPLDDLIDEHAPDFPVVEAMKDWYRNEDGHWYGYANFYYDLEDSAARGIDLPTHNVVSARDDIMNELGITAESMRTKDGFMEALEMVKEANYQYNGLDVYPLYPVNGGLGTWYLAEQFGVDREDEEGNYINIWREPEYLEALLFMNEAFNKGLIPDEAFTADRTTMDQRMASGQVFACIGLSGAGALYGSDNAAAVLPIGYIEGTSGKDPIITPSPTGGWTGTYISRNCENPDRAVQLMSFLAQEEMALTEYNGGYDGYFFNDEGYVEIKPEVKQMMDEDPTTFNATRKTPAVGYVLDFVYQMENSPPIPTEGTLDNLAYYASQDFEIAPRYDDKIFSNVLPEGGSDLAAMKSQIDTYWSTQEPQIIMAETPEEAERIYNETITALDAMGMTELDEYRNERFQENKEKMGVEFAWPRNQ